MTHLNQEAYQKFKHGDGLTDDELRNLLNFHEDTLAQLDQLGAEYRLAANAIRDHLFVLKSFQRARKE